MDLKRLWTKSISVSCVAQARVRGATDRVMAAALERHVLAAQKFLASVKHLPSFAECRDKQLDGLRKKISSHAFLVQEAAHLVGLLDDDIWQASLDSLKESFCLKDEGSERKNVSLQDYLAMPHYLTAATWKSLSEDPRPVALEKLCRHLKNLGLRNPSEATQGMVLCLVFDLEGKMLGSQQWSVTLKEKANVQKYLKSNPGSPHLTVLPLHRTDCAPELMQRAFATEEPMDCIVEYADLLLRAKDWPMRTTHRFAQGRGRSVDIVASTDNEEQAFLSKMGHVMAGFVKNQFHQSDGYLPGLKLFPQKEKEQTKIAVPTLALEDKKEEPAASSMDTKAEASAPPAGESAVAQSLQALQREISEKPESKAKVPKAKVTKKVLKKPASRQQNAPASKAASKKPAAKAATALRRPAAAVARQSASARQTETREERRLRLIDVFVPKSLQREYKDGCPKCYGRKGCTLSCWKLRGFAMTD